MTTTILAIDDDADYLAMLAQYLLGALLFADAQQERAYARSS